MQLLAGNDMEPEVTTFKSVNLAINAKSIKAKVSWSFVTVAATLTLIVIVARLIETYYKNETTVITRLKINRNSFPAVTFCNMNPYKKSAVASMPELAQLLNSYNQIARKNKTTEKQDSIRKRRKRQGCACASTQTATISGRTFKRTSGTVSWNCAYSCCSSLAAVGQSGVPPILDNGALISALKGTIIQDAPAWIGMYGTQGYPTASYYWCSDTSGTHAGSAVNVSTLCAGCQAVTAASNWNDGGPVTIKTQGDNVIFANWGMTTTSEQPLICEISNSFTKAEPLASSSSSMTLSTSTSALATLETTKKQIIPTVPILVTVVGNPLVAGNFIPGVTRNFLLQIQFLQDFQFNQIEIDLEAPSSVGLPRFMRLCNPVLLNIQGQIYINSIAVSSITFALQLQSSDSSITYDEVTLKAPDANYLAKANTNISVAFQLSHIGRSRNSPVGDFQIPALVYVSNNPPNRESVSGHLDRTFADLNYITKPVYSFSFQHTGVPAAAAQIVVSTITIKSDATVADLDVKIWVECSSSLPQISLVSLRFISAGASWGCISDLSQTDIDVLFLAQFPTPCNSHFRLGDIYFGHVANAAGNSGTLEATESLIFEASFFVENAISVPPNEALAPYNITVYDGNVVIANATDWIPLQVDTTTAKAPTTTLHLTTSTTAPTNGKIMVTSSVTSTTPSTSVSSTVTSTSATVSDATSPTSAGLTSIVSTTLLNPMASTTTPTASTMLTTMASTAMPTIFSTTSSTAFAASFTSPALPAITTETKVTNGTNSLIVTTCQSLTMPTTYASTTLPDSSIATSSVMPINQTVTTLSPAATTSIPLTNSIFSTTTPSSTPFVPVSTTTSWSNFITPSRTTGATTSTETSSTTTTIVLLSSQASTESTNFATSTKVNEFGSTASTTTAATTLGSTFMPTSITSSANYVYSSTLEKTTQLTSALNDDVDLSTQTASVASVEATTVPTSNDTVLTTLLKTNTNVITEALPTSAIPAKTTSVTEFSNVTLSLMSVASPSSMSTTLSPDLTSFLTTHLTFAITSFESTTTTAPMAVSNSQSSATSSVFNVQSLVPPSVQSTLFLTPEISVQPATIPLAVTSTSFVTDAETLSSTSFKDSNNINTQGSLIMSSTARPTSFELTELTNVSGLSSSESYSPRLNQSSTSGFVTPLQAIAQSSMQSPVPPIVLSTITTPTTNVKTETRASDIQNEVTSSKTMQSLLSSAASNLSTLRKRKLTSSSPKLTITPNPTFTSISPITLLLSSDSTGNAGSTTSSVITVPFVTSPSAKSRATLDTRAPSELPLTQVTNPNNASNTAPIFPDATSISPSQSDQSEDNHPLTTITSVSITETAQSELPAFNIKNETTAVFRSSTEIVVTKINEINTDNTVKENPLTSPETSGEPTYNSGESTFTNRGSTTIEFTTTANLLQPATTTPLVRQTESNAVATDNAIFVSQLNTNLQVTTIDQTYVRDYNSTPEETTISNYITIAADAFAELAELNSMSTTIHDNNAALAANVSSSPSSSQSTSALPTSSPNNTITTTLAKDDVTQSEIMQTLGNTSDYFITSALSNTVIASSSTSASENHISSSANFLSTNFVKTSVEVSGSSSEPYFVSKTQMPIGNNETLATADELTTTAELRNITHIPVSADNVSQLAHISTNQVEIANSLLTPDPFLSDLSLLNDFTTASLLSHDQLNSGTFIYGQTDLEEVTISQATFSSIPSLDNFSNFDSPLSDTNSVRQTSIENLNVTKAESASILAFAATILPQSNNTFTQNATLAQNPLFTEDPLTQPNQMIDLLQTDMLVTAQLILSQDKNVPTSEVPLPLKKIIAATSSVTNPLNGDYRNGLNINGNKPQTEASLFSNLPPQSYSIEVDSFDAFSETLNPVGYELFESTTNTQNKIGDNKLSPNKADTILQKPDLYTTLSSAQTPGDNKNNPKNAESHSPPLVNRAPGNSLLNANTKPVQNQSLSDTNKDSSSTFVSDSSNTPDASVSIDETIDSSVSNAVSFDFTIDNLSTSSSMKNQQKSTALVAQAVGLTSDTSDLFKPLLQKSIRPLSVVTDEISSDNNLSLPATSTDISKIKNENFNAQVPTVKAAVSNKTFDLFKKQDTNHSVNPSTDASDINKEKAQTRINESAAITEAIDKALTDVVSDENAVTSTSSDILAYLLASLPMEKKIKVGYDITELLGRCAYDGVQCSAKDFTLKLDPNYGNCYTFNAGGEHVVAQQPGQGRGLQVAYYIGQDQYLDFVQAAGVRIVIHGQNETIFPDAAGFNMPSGYQSIAAMRQIQTKSISSKAKLCAKSSNDVPTFNYVNTLYSTEGCLRSCYQKGVIENCACGDPRVPLPINQSNNYCDVTKRDCVNAYFTFENDSSSNCYCPPECRNDIFATSLSMTKWSIFQGSRDLYFSGNNTTSHNGNQLAKVEVYFEELTIVEYFEIQAYDIYAVLYDISAVIGLFLGASVLSLFEIADLMDYVRRKSCG